MKNVLTIVLLFFVCIAGNAQLDHGYSINPVPFTSVKVTNGFWGQCLRAIREVTIPLAFSKCEETGTLRKLCKGSTSKLYVQSRRLLF